MKKILIIKLEFKKNFISLKNHFKELILETIVF